MKIGIVIAVERELVSFLESSYTIEEKYKGKIKYYCTKINNNEIYAIKSGWGLIDAAAATQFMISVLDCSAIINFGVTGALDPELEVKELFMVNRCMNYDFDTSCIDPVKKHQYAEYNDEFIPLDRELIEFVKGLRDIKEVNCCSGDQFIEKREDKIERFEAGCQICDMEIAAIARICSLNEVKCLSIKCISDAFDGDGSDFNSNVREASDKAFRLIDEILRKL